MSRPGEEDAPRVGPNVYLPYAVADPAPYERYADPAAAHGWENAYDETQRLPRVPPPEAVGGRAERRRAARPSAGRRARRVRVAAGAAGVASLAVLRCHP
ncbi:hypothetical protein [Streptomyces scabiei]|uniref:hypothetical protein n=1 Tax=Streptomyces scabiei TaxID=1930 RepID=UPI0029B8BF1D|nr:hypothetical protein [Streptomyces scabiei]MDX3117540.1 hypothetical protein [Streptomyces scabiei]